MKVAIKHHLNLKAHYNTVIVVSTLIVFGNCVVKLHGIIYYSCVDSLGLGKQMISTIWKLCLRLWWGRN